MLTSNEKPATLLDQVAHEHSRVEVAHLALFCWW